MKESFFEIGAIFVVASGSVGPLRKLQGGASKIDRRRFRPNIYIESGPAWSGFVEDSWTGGSLEIGGTVRIQEFQPTIWCVTSTLAQEDLPRDLSILRTIANNHKRCFGAYATVSKPGLVHVEDPVILLKEENVCSRQRVVAADQIMGPRTDQRIEHPCPQLLFKGFHSIGTIPRKFHGSSTFLL